MAQRRRKKRTVQEFKPDKVQTNFLDKLYLTKRQRATLLRWFSYGAICLVLLLIQDVIMSRVSIFGTTTDLVVAAIFLIGIYYGPETGGLFTLIASLLYLFAGSAPGPYVIAIMIFPVVGLGAFRVAFLQRGFSSTVLCAGICVMVYEIAVFGVGVFLGLTMWSRFIYFVITGLLTVAVMLPLYPLVNAIAKIGGEPWKE